MIEKFEFTKSKHSGPKIELIDDDETMAISINPIEVWHPNFHPLSFIKKEYEKLKQAANGVELELYPESSPTGRIHFHGFITVRSKWGYLATLAALPSIGTYCIKQFFDKETSEEDDVDSSSESEPQSETSESEQDEEATAAELDPLEEGVQESVRKNAENAWLEYCLKQEKLFQPLFIKSIMNYPLHVLPVIKEPSPYTITH